MIHARSQLYVPGDRADRLAKAMGRGADALIVDLEDSVAAASKFDARRNAVQWLAGAPRFVVPVWVRVNAGEERERDIAALAGFPNLAGLVLAKTDSATDVEDAARQLTLVGSELRLAPLIESAGGVCAVGAIAAAPRVDFLHLGEIDLAADIGASPSPDGAELLYARSALVMASRAADIGPPVAPVDAQIDDLEQFRVTTDSLSRMGFVGRACIHPAQVTIANAVFTPHSDDIRWAREVLEILDANPHGVCRDVNGRMIDEAVLRRARGLISTADARLAPQ